MTYWNILFIFDTLFFVLTAFTVAYMTFYAIASHIVTTFKN